MLNFITESEQEIHIYIADPSQFIQQNQHRLLPTWTVSITHIILILQKSQFPLENSSQEIEEEKDYLRARFLRFGGNLVFQLGDAQYQSDLFDPRNGYPLLSRCGEITLSDTTVVRDLLGFEVIKQQCSLLIHPQWGTAIYPSTIVTSAPLEVITQFVEKINPTYLFVSQ